MRAESCKFGFRVLALKMTNRLSASDASVAINPLARAIPTSRSVSSRLASASTASMPAFIARSTRSSLLSTTTKEAPAFRNSSAAPRPTRPKPHKIMWPSSLSIMLLTRRFPKN